MGWSLGARKFYCYGNYKVLCIDLVTILEVNQMVSCLSYGHTVFHTNMIYVSVFTVGDVWCLTGVGCCHYHRNIGTHLWAHSN